VTAYDEHGPQRDQAAADAAVRIRPAACNGGPGARLLAAPNPFRGALRITGPAGTHVTIFDLSGRRRLAAVLDGRGDFAWDGRDDTGRAVAPGLYFRARRQRAAADEAGAGGVGGLAAASFGAAPPRPRQAFVR